MRVVYWIVAICIVIVCLQWKNVHVDTTGECNSLPLDTWPSDWHVEYIRPGLHAYALHDITFAGKSIKDLHSHYNYVITDVGNSISFLPTITVDRMISMLEKSQGWSSLMATLTPYQFFYHRMCIESRLFTPDQLNALFANISISLYAAQSERFIELIMRPYPGWMVDAFDTENEEPMYCAGIVAYNAAPPTIGIAYIQNVFFVVDGPNTNTDVYRIWL